MVVVLLFVVLVVVAVIMDAGCSLRRCGCFVVLCCCLCSLLVQGGLKGLAPCSRFGAVGDHDVVRGRLVCSGGLGGAFAHRAFGWRQLVAAAVSVHR